MRFVSRSPVFLGLFLDLQNIAASLAQESILVQSDMSLYSGGNFFGLDTKCNDSVVCYTF